MARTSKMLLWALIITAVAFVSPPGRADDAATVLSMLKQPGVHAIMRHALAPGTGDPGEFRLDDCTTQRNLDDRGREQARAIGEALKGHGIVFDRILTSQWCRCRETAALLGLGTPDDFPGLNSFFQDRSTADAQTEAVRALLTALPQGERALLVTHQVNITALTGRGVSSGEVFLIKTGPDGKVRVIGEFLVPAG